MRPWMLSLTVLATCVPTGHAAESRVVTYPAPAGEPRSEDYQVWADGKEVDVYVARVLDAPFAGKEWDFGGPYAFANLDISGPVKVKIVSKRSLKDTAVRPDSLGIRPMIVDDRTIILELKGPAKISVEPDGKKGPLLLFANPVEAEPLKTDAPGVVFFGPGIHRPERIELGDGQTLAIAGGAVVKGGVVVRGSKVRIRGRGILDGSDWPWTKGPTGALLDIQGSDVEVSGITIRGSFGWTIVPRGSRNVAIRGVKICNSRVQNDDGINPCNSQDVLITDCFIRSDDDCVALKGLDFRSSNSNVERIVVENSTLWCDRARIFLLGHESRAEFMRDITIRNLDIIHFSMTAFLLEPGEDMKLENVVVEDVRVHGEGQGELIRLKPVVNQYMRKNTPGFVRDVRFKKVAVSGRPGRYLVQLEGADEKHSVRDVRFEDVEILSAMLSAASPQVRIGKFVEGLRFLPE